MLRRHAMHLVVSGLLVGACTDDSLPPPSGEHYQYVVSDLHIPASSTEARQFGLDLNADRVVDNELGSVFATLQRMGLGVADTANEALLRGGLIMLADLETSSFDNARSSGVTMYLGSDPVPDPCLDPTRLETCGQHLLGDGQFAVDEATASKLAVAPIKNGALQASMPRLAVEIALDPTAPLRLDLHAARISLSAITPTSVSAVLAGGITMADVNAIVIPEAAAQMERIVTAECGQARGDECGCVQGSRAKALQDFFDIDLDCHISNSEVASSDITQALLSPDVVINGESLLSFGLGVDLASATF